MPKPTIRPSPVYCGCGGEMQIVDRFVPTDPGIGANDWVCLTCHKLWRVWDIELLTFFMGVDDSPSAPTKAGIYRTFGLYRELDGWYAENAGGTLLGPFDTKIDTKEAVDKTWQARALTPS